jgi:hypothetical protein
LDEDIKLTVLVHQLDLHALAHLLPRQVERVLFPLGQTSLGRADQVLQRRFALAPHGVHRFGGNAAVHHKC